jgi:oligopeptidase A
MTNPLLYPAHELPDFAAVRPEHVAPAMDTLVAQAEQALAEVTAPNFPADWHAVALVLDVATERLSTAWGVVGHLNAVADTPELRAAYTEALPKVTAFWTTLGSSDALFEKVKQMDPTRLNAEQQRARELGLRNFVLGGAQLEGAAKQRFADIQERQAELAQAFGEHALDATDAFSLCVPAERMAGLPEDLCQSTAADAQAKGLSGHLLSLKMPCYLPVMQFAQDRALRETLYRAYVTRASDQAEGDGASERDNSAIMDEILALRFEEAQLLGFEHYAALSLAAKMATHADEVTQLLSDLAVRARPHAERDVAELRAFAAQHLGLNDPQASDWTYIGEKLKEARYAYSEQEVKPYFQAPRVLQGLFKLVETLFQVRIHADKTSVWHDSVEFFRIERDNAQGQAQLIGQFYLDPQARAGKRGGAWMNDVRGRWLRPDTQVLQTPVAHMVCNFAKGVGDKPALLTHDDVITLFHEFGHALHHMLTQVNEHDIAGISGVEWDAVELPSQFMENFCWDWSVLQDLTAHVDTGEPLPRALFDKMLAARHFQSGMQTLRQVEFSLLDMRLHLQAKADVMATLRQVRQEFAVLPSPPYSRTPHTFSHIFAGGYAAGYYSYKWAEVLSADAFSAFEEAATLRGSVVDPTTGEQFLREVLEAGAKRDAMESFKAFRGREPRIDALLRHSGMAEPEAA